MIYLDDASGAKPIPPGETIHPELLPGTLDAETASMQPVPPAHASRADVHMAITAATFREAGWDIAAPKVQCGTKIKILGLDVATEGTDHPQGAIIFPEAKRLGLLRDIAHQMDGREKASGPEVQQLVGRLSHMSRVAAEARLYLGGLYSASAWANKRSARNKMITINGPGYAPIHYQDCLHWWKTALEHNIHVPLAIPAVFRKPGAPGCTTLFTDAAREEGTGGGAFLAIHTARLGPVLLWCEFDWPEDIQKSLMENQLSMPAGE